MFSWLVRSEDLKIEEIVWRKLVNFQLYQDSLYNNPLSTPSEDKLELELLWLTRSSSYLLLWPKVTQIVHIMAREWHPSHSTLPHQDLG
jgi:hypothetical protein